jgi:hypothetical protein
MIRGRRRYKLEIAAGGISLLAKCSGPIVKFYVIKLIP